MLSDGVKHGSVVIYKNSSTGAIKMAIVGLRYGYVYILTDITPWSNVSLPAERF